MKDALTGLDSYEVFLGKLQKEIDTMGDDKIGIIYTDIKHFKYINDTYGYKVGDSLLKEFVDELMQGGEYILCSSRVYSDNFVAANRIKKGTRSNEEFREMIYQINRDWEAKFGRNT